MCLGVFDGLSGGEERLVLSFNVDAAPAEGTVLNVFLNKDSADVRTPTTGPRFAGTVSLVPLRKGAPGKRALTLELDITEQASQLLANESELTVRFVPLDGSGRALTTPRSPVTLTGLGVQMR